MLRICPSVPITRRSASCLQFGVEDPVLIDGLLPADTALIDDLRIGLGSAQFYARAQVLGIDLARATSLISLLGEAGVLIPEGADSTTMVRGTGMLATARIFHQPPDRVAEALSSREVCALGPLGGTMRRQLSRSGFAVSAATRLDDLDLLSRPIVITSSHLVPDLHSATWLVDREIDHCQIVCGEFSVELTGLVRPGASPCTVCGCLERKDEDEEWFDHYPRIRELSDRDEMSDPLAAGLAAVGLVVLLRAALLGDLPDPVRRRIDLRTGAMTDEELRFHPRCQCRVPVPRLDLAGEQAQ